MSRKVLKYFLSSGFHYRIGKGNGYFAHVFFVIGFVGTTTLIAGSANSKIIVAGNGWNISFPYLINYFIGPYIITNQVAKAIDCVWFAAVNIFEKMPPAQEDSHVYR